MDLRILFANFLVGVLPLLMIAAGIILVVRSRTGNRGASPWRHVGIFLLALPLGILVYIIAGIVAASMRGDGHFYSVPFGGYSVWNNGVILSLIVWIALTFAGLAALLRPRA